MLAEAQCFTHWELLRRLHDMIVVFDMEGLCIRVPRQSMQLPLTFMVCNFHPLAGIIVFISPAVQDMLGYAPTELFNQPLASILHPDCHGIFEGHVQRIMEIQFKRPLQGQELLSSFIFRSRAGMAVPLDGVGQAWQRGRNVEFVMSFRARHATQAPVAVQPLQGQVQMSGGSVAQSGTSVPYQVQGQQHMSLSGQQHMSLSEQQHAVSGEGGSAVPHVMPPQQSGFQPSQGQGTRGMPSIGIAMPPPAVSHMAPNSAGMQVMMSSRMYMPGMSAGATSMQAGVGGSMFGPPPTAMSHGAPVLNVASLPMQSHGMQQQQQVWHGGTMQQLSTGSHLMGMQSMQQPIVMPATGAHSGSR
jgi:hypothetical protein